MNPRTQRRWLADQAARCMSEFLIDDPLQALRRVMQRQRAVPDRRNWPDADEIRTALRDHQRLFHGPRQSRQLSLRREAAVEAMDFFAGFRPRLVGSVLDGTADAHSPVQLHLHSDDPEAVLLFLQEHAIAHRVGERRIHLRPRQPEPVPWLRFDADGIEFQLWVLPASSARQSPLQADGQTPMTRASRSRVLQLGAEA
jgi:hypothetical protein